MAIPLFDYGSDMPMGQSAKPPMDAASVVAPVPAAPPQAAGVMQSPQGGAMGFPAPSAPTEPPFVVELQPDGSSIYKSKTEPPIVLGVNKPPKLPKALNGGAQ
jgi:hypothetical protein